MGHVYHIGCAKSPEKQSIGCIQSILHSDICAWLNHTSFASKLAGWDLEHWWWLRREFSGFAYCAASWLAMFGDFGFADLRKRFHLLILLIRGIVAPSQVDCEVFVFFVFFVPVQVWCTLKFKTFVLLSLCRFRALWSSKLVFFLSLCRFGALWSSKTNALLHVYCDIISIVCRLLCLYLHFLLPMQLFEGSGAFFMPRVYNLKIDLILFKNRFCFQEIGVFSFLKCQCI